MKRTAISTLLCFVFFLCYCEGLDTLLKKMNYIPSSNIENEVPTLAEQCDGDATFIESSSIICEEIKGDLTIKSTSLRSLDTFSAIEVVNGSVIIESNNLLNNISGLNQIKYVEKDFIVNDNARLTEAEVRRVILKILNDKGHIGGNIIFNHIKLDIEIYVTIDV